MHGPPRPECTSLLNGPVYSVVKIVRMKSDIICIVQFCGSLLVKHFVSLRTIFLQGTGCALDCSLDRLRLLAYSHVLYHSLKNDNECVNASGIIKDSNFIQQKSSNLVKALRPLVT